MTCMLIIASCGTGDDADRRITGAREQPASGLWVTFEVEDDRFRALVVDPAATDLVLEWARTGAQPGPPLGEVRNGGELNFPWSWHLDPATVRFDEPGVAVVAEDCRTRPSTFEGGGADRSCSLYWPRGAVITSAQDCRDGSCEAIGTQFTPGAGPPAGASGTSGDAGGYDPCAGKQCGDFCRICPPGDSNCFETAAVKACNALGQCAIAAPVCQ